MSNFELLQQVYLPVLKQDLRILVTDDDPIMREFATVYLGSEAAALETACCGEEALERLERSNFDLMLLDLDMPGMNGYEVIEHVRRDRKFNALPIVVVTSNEDMGSIDRAYSAGATSFVIKPVNWRLLAYQLQFVMRAHHRAGAGAGQAH